MKINHCTRVESVKMVAKTGKVMLPRDASGRRLLTGQTAPGIEVA
jgi:hypothetical protein